jgi:hypothetical protein
MTIGGVPSDSSHCSAFKEQTVIKLLEAYYLGEKKIDLLFSDGSRGVFDVQAYCAMRDGRCSIRSSDRKPMLSVF